MSDTGQSGALVPLFKNSAISTPKIDKLKKQSSKVEMLWADSPMSDLSCFKERLSKTKYADADLDYYHERIENWALAKGSKAKYADWARFAMNFMLRDLADGRLRKANKPPSAVRVETQINGWLQASETLAKLAERENE